MAKKERLYKLMMHINAASRAELLSEAKALVGKGGAIYTPNPIMLYDALNNPKLYSALMRGVNIPDGVGVKVGLSYLGIDTEVFAGVELAKELLSGANASFAVIGGSYGRAEAAGRALEAIGNGSRCVLALDGYSYGEAQIEAALDIASPKVVLVCYGSPKQELFIDKIRDKFKGTLFLGLGGSVDIYSGAKLRAPAVLRKMRLEWLYRMMREPRRFSGLLKILKFLYLAKMVGKYRSYPRKNAFFIKKR